MPAPWAITSSQVSPLSFWWARRKMPAPTATSPAIDLTANPKIFAARAYLNEGGRLLYTGKYAGYESAFGYEFNIETNAPCDPDSASDGCQPLSDDFLQ